MCRSAKWRAEIAPAAALDTVVDPDGYMSASSSSTGTIAIGDIAIGAVTVTFCNQQPGAACEKLTSGLPSCSSSPDKAGPYPRSGTFNVAWTVCAQGRGGSFLDLSSEQNTPFERLMVGRSLLLEREGSAE